jgi:hypothetical protein
MYSKFHKGLSLDGFRGTNLADFPNLGLYMVISIYPVLHFHQMFKKNSILESVMVLEEKQNRLLSKLKQLEGWSVQTCT